MSDALPLEQAGGAWRPMGHSQPRPKWDYEFTLEKVLQTRVNHRCQLLKPFILAPLSFLFIYFG
jgi:hypothetical protein